MLLLCQKWSNIKNSLFIAVHCSNIGNDTNDLANSSIDIDCDNNKTDGNDIQIIIDVQVELILIPLYFTKS